MMIIALVAEHHGMYIFPQGFMVAKKMRNKKQFAINAERFIKKIIKNNKI